MVAPYTQLLLLKLSSRRMMVRTNFRGKMRQKGEKDEAPRSPWCYRTLNVVVVFGGGVTPCRYPTTCVGPYMKQVYHLYECTSLQVWPKAWPGLCLVGCVLSLGLACSSSPGGGYRFSCLAVFGLQSTLLDFKYCSIKFPRKSGSSKQKL